MTWIIATDPLALVAIQAGQIGTPSKEAAAAGATKLDSPQRSTEIGEPVPIVFARRRNNAGGVLISPGATECRFENDEDNAVTAFYHLVLSEGRISPVSVRDVFQGLCRVGQYTQTYNRRAGTWIPENVIVQRDGFVKPEASYYCGSRGSYPDMSTMSFKITVPDGFDYWKLQVHVFVRGGMWVTRLFDNQTGPSDNFADLVKWMLSRSGRLDASLVDNQGLLNAATFLEANQFRCNTNITKSTNYSDLLSRWAPYFILSESNVLGKRGLRPLLPVNSNGTINVNPIVPVFTFTEDNILLNTVEIQYTSWADRRPFVAQMIWRQQPDDDFGIIRTAEVRFAGTALDGPYESHDMSEFCCTENHAVKAGAYIVAKRRFTSHTIRFTARPQANNTVVVGGSIIRVRLARNATSGNVGFHDYLYQVERITKTLSGELSYECVHFPVDDQGRSLVALFVVNTNGTGLLFTNNRSGLGCDINSASNTSVPNEEFTVPGPSDPGIDLGTGSESPPGDTSDNPDDGLDSPPTTPGPATVTSPSDTTGLVPGSKIDVPSACGNETPAEIIVFKNGVEIASYNGSRASGDQLIQTDESALLLTNGVITGVIAIAGNEGDVYTVEVVCPDGSRTSVEATLNPNPFPEAFQVYFFDYKVGITSGWRNSQYVSVGSPPILRGSADTGFAIYVTDSNGNSVAPISGPVISGLRITRFVYAGTASGITTSGVYNIVSTINY